MPTVEQTRKLIESMGEFATDSIESSEIIEPENLTTMIKMSRPDDLIRKESIVGNTQPFSMFDFVSHVYKDDNLPETVLRLIVDRNNSLLHYMEATSTTELNALVSHVNDLGAKLAPYYRQFPKLFWIGEDGLSKFLDEFVNWIVFMKVAVDKFKHDGSDPMLFPFLQLFVSEVCSNLHVVGALTGYLKHIGLDVIPNELRDVYTKLTGSSSYQKPLGTKEPEMLTKLRSLYEKSKNEHDQSVEIQMKDRVGAQPNIQSKISCHCNQIKEKCGCTQKLDEPKKIELRKRMAEIFDQSDVLKTDPPSDGTIVGENPLFTRLKKLMSPSVVQIPSSKTSSDPVVTNLKNMMDKFKGKDDRTRLNTLILDMKKKYPLIKDGKGGEVKKMEGELVVSIKEMNDILSRKQYGKISKENKEFLLLVSKDYGNI